MDVDFSIRGADGNWKNNTYIFHAEQAYTTAKNFMSKIDTNGLGFNLKYPVPVVRKLNIIVIYLKIL